MEANFWHSKWQRGEIGFHREEVNPILLAHWEKLGLAQGKRVFLPLCGKTKDIAYLINQGYQVVGVELSETAVRELFAEMSLTPEITESEHFHSFSVENMLIFVGDFFQLTPELIGHVDAIYDRAALVALPLTMRHNYTAHLTQFTAKAPQLVVTYEYQQELIDGPPFSISEQEVAQHYAENYTIELIARAAVEGGMKGKVPSSEAVYLLR